jgi:hypothetical protein
MSDEQKAALVASLPEHWVMLVVPLSKKVLKAGYKDPKDPNAEWEYFKIGQMAIPIPTLAAFGINSPVRAKTDDDNVPEGSEALPLYADPNIDWLFDAAVAACKAQARNCYVSGTAELKEGKSIPANFAELIATGEKIGNKIFMQMLKEAGNAFASWFSGLGKSAPASAMAVTLFRKKDALALQPATIKEKMAGYISQFAEQLEPADADRYSKYLLSIAEACQAATAEDF